MTEELAQLYATRKTLAGHAFAPAPFNEAQLISSFPHEDTPDQAQATAATFADMEAPTPMNRLICGDVGFGKTEVVIRAALKAVSDGKQVAVLVPTTVLALQHAISFEERLKDFGIVVGQLHRFLSPTKQRTTREEVAKGKIEIVIATSALLSKEVRFKDLGLLVIDEEQKFGVRLKERLQMRYPQVDVLSLSATPIPRTLHASLIGLRDISLIATPPARRQPIYTTIHTFDRDLIREAIAMERLRGGQVFYVRDKIEQLIQTEHLLRHLIPDISIETAHGQLPAEALERSMTRFINKACDVLLSTNIIENGLDIPNANTIIIQDAHTFGLSDLHQMRGRVGRSQRKAFCYLLSPPAESLTPQATKRLAAVESFVNLGDGYLLAQRDLDIRGAGNLLGTEQSGFMADIGFDAYHKILNEVLSQSDTSLHKGIPQQDSCLIESEFTACLPASYVSSPRSRMALYQRFNQVKDNAGLDSLCKELEDRFGPLPTEARGLAAASRLRLLAAAGGFGRLSLKGQQLKAYFSPTKGPFAERIGVEQLLLFIQRQGGGEGLGAQIEEISPEKGCLTLDNIDSFERAAILLKDLIEGGKANENKASPSAQTRPKASVEGVLGESQGG